MPEPHQIPGDTDDRPLPVLAEARTIEHHDPPSLPATIAAATGGFLLGVAAFLAVRVLRRPGRPGRRPAARRRRDRGGDPINIAASRSFLVDIHLLRDR
jgi:hypothetical protein